MPSEIEPNSEINSGKFYFHSTAADVLRDEDLTNKSVLVTGGTAGLGAATVRALAEKNATVYFTGRDVGAGEKLIGEIRAGNSNCKVQFIRLDLCKFQNVRDFVDTFEKATPSLDILILNAGIFGFPYELSSDGFEMTYQIHVLSQLYLLHLLKSLLTKATLPRVVFVASDSHRNSNLTLENLNKELMITAENYNVRSQYANAKFFQIQLCSFLARYWRESGISFYSCHPGDRIHTNLGRSSWYYQLILLLRRPFSKTVDQGAATIVYCAASRNAAGKSGKYWRDCQPVDPSPTAQNPVLGQAVWKICMDIIEYQKQK